MVFNSWNEYIIFFIIGTTICSIFYLLGYLFTLSYHKWEKTDATIVGFCKRGRYSKNSIVNYTFKDVQYTDIKLLAFGWGYKKGRIITIAVSPKNPEYILSKSSGSEYKTAAVVCWLGFCIILPLLTNYEYLF